MKNKTRILFLIFLLALPISAQEKSKNDDLMLKLSKAFDVFGAVYRELLFNYVVDIDPEELMESGISGMLNALDPYTSYAAPSDDEENDFILSDKYVGIGIQTDTLDNMLTISAVYNDSPSWKAGIRVGDKILSVDGTVLLHEDGTALRKKTIGKKGTQLEIKVIRSNGKDTLTRTLIRDDIQVSSIINSELLTGNIGYIKVNQFSYNTSQEFKSALIDLMLKSKLNGLIIDERNNPGGLISTAVEICELFVPPGIDLVRTKGKKSKSDYTYQSMGIPVDTALPLVVLINENSASAAEILAGVMQDLDRAVIIGNRSFGKGLVQSVVETPDGGSLKITSAKYYIPSGRCIQKLDYKIAKEPNGLSVHHDSVYYTRNKRVVLESSGIIPDVTVSHDTTNEYCSRLEHEMHFFRFADKYCSGRDSLNLDFTVDDKILKEFKRYLTESGFLSDGDFYGRLLALSNDAKGKVDKKLMIKVTAITKDFEKVNDLDFDANLEFIKQALENEILLRFYPMETVQMKSLIKDKVVLKASSVIGSKEYNLILRKSVNN